MAIVLKQLENYDYEGINYDDNYTFYINIQDTDPSDPETDSVYYITLCNMTSLSPEDYCLGTFRCNNLDSALHIAFNYNNLPS